MVGRRLWMLAAVAGLLAIGLWDWAGLDRPPAGPPADEAPATSRRLYAPPPRPTDADDRMAPSYLQLPPPLPAVERPAIPPRPPASANKNPAARQLWRAWRGHWARADHQPIPLLGARLARQMQRRPDDSVYQQLGRLVADETVPVQSKALLLDLLAEMATPQALGLLLGLADRGPQLPGYFLVLAAIARIGDNRWRGEFHEELSPALQAVWENPQTSEPGLLNAVGTAMAKIGAPEGVERLLLTLAGDDAAGQPQDTARAKQEAAFLALPQTRNPKAAPVLGDWLRQERPGAPTAAVSGEALAGMDSAEATGELLRWAKDAPDEGARDLRSWLARLDDEAAVAAVADADVMGFHSMAVAEVVQAFNAGLKDGDGLALPEDAWPETRQGLR